MVAVVTRHSVLVEMALGEKQIPVTAEMVSMPTAMLCADAAMFSVGAAMAAKALVVV